MKTIRNAATIIVDKITSVDSSGNDHTCNFAVSDSIVVTDTVQTPEAADYVVFYDSNKPLPCQGVPYIVLEENAWFLWTAPFTEDPEPPPMY